MSRLVTNVVALAGAAALAGSVAWTFSLDEKLSSAPRVRATTPHAPPSSASPSTASSRAPVATSAQPTAASAQSASSQPAQVGQAAAAQSASSTQAVAPKAGEPAPAPGSAGQRVSIDPKTGQLRPIEHDEAAALAAAAAAQGRAARKAAVQPQESFGPGGSVTIDIPEDLHTYTVATRRADGTIAVEHATGPKAAQKKVKTGAAAKKSPAAPVQDKEDRDDR